MCQSLCFICTLHKPIFPSGMFCSHQTHVQCNGLQNMNIGTSVIKRLALVKKELCVDDLQLTLNRLSYKFSEIYRYCICVNKHVHLWQFLLTFRRQKTIPFPCNSVFQDWFLKQQTIVAIINQLTIHVDEGGGENIPIIKICFTNYTQ